VLQCRYLTSLDMFANSRAGCDMIDALLGNDMYVCVGKRGYIWVM
jgi:hypothetical protein